MSSKVPESTRLAYARQLADEAKTLVPGMERLSEIAAELRADDLFRLLGFNTWERFCTDYLGVSKRTANRWIAGPSKAAAVSASDTQRPKSIGAGQRVAAGQNVPIVESDTLKSAKSPEGLDQQDYSGPASEPTKPGGADSANDLPTPSGPSSGGARTTAPRLETPTGEAPTSPGPAPLDRHAHDTTQDHVDVDAIGLRWLKSKNTREVRAIGDPWGPAIRSEVMRWASAFGLSSASRPGPSERLNGTAGRPSARVTPSAARIGGKRHADDCSCLSCVPPKAASK